MSDILSTDSGDLAEGRRLRLALFLAAIAPLVLIVWAAFAELAEVAIGEGRVVPSTKSQVIQSSDSGVVAEIRVTEGEQVEPGQILALLDPAVAEASLGENAAKIEALRLRAARLQAEVSGKAEVSFPADVSGSSAQRANELELFRARRDGFQTTLTDIRANLTLARQELALLRPLVESGAANKLELLRAEQKAAELQAKENDATNSYVVDARKSLAETMAELDPLLQVQAARTTQLSRTEIRSPVSGVVKEIKIPTIGGVVPPGGELFEIVPSDDRLLIEARISPRDIAFIHPGQAATIKITAYDSSIYGKLDGRVELISPDTVEDEVNKGVYYYRVQLRTDKAQFTTADGVAHPILPGMIASAEIRTGTNTVLNYLIKPLNRAGEALRER